MNVSETGIL